MIFAAIVVAMMVSITGLARAQDVDVGRLLQRLDRLERDLQDLQRSYYRDEKPPRPRSGRLTAPSGTPPSGPRLAGAELRMSRLETQMRSLTGRIEEVRHGIDQVGGRLDKLIADVDFRLTQIETRLRSGAPLAEQDGQPAAPKQTALGRRSDAAAPPRAQARAAATPAAATQAAVTAPAPSILPQGNAADRYNFAFSLLRKADFARAQQAFMEFLQLHGDDRLAGNAYYWLGETYYSRGNLQDAARVFLTGFEKFPEGIKAPDTMLKLAITLSRMKQHEEACSTLSELKKRFATLSRSVSKRSVAEWRKNKCG